MLQFFRKYQKFFFVIVTFLVVVSFSFFGTSSTFGRQGEKVPDREIGKLVDGTSLMEQRQQGMARLLKHGMEEGGRTINLLTDSFVHREFVLNGLAEIFLEHHFDHFAPTLQEKWERMKNYVPYSHPYAPQINARAVWNQMAPEINQLLEEVKAAPPEFTADQLPLMCKLYFAQADFPPMLLLQMLYYQQMQGGKIRPDQGLPSANVALFGFESIEDWFGAPFIDDLATFIFNTAILAKQDGYQVSKREAQEELFRNVVKGIKALGQSGEMTGEQVQNAYLNQLRMIGLSEAEAIEHYRDLMLVKRLFHEVGESLFIDPIAITQFKQFAAPSQTVVRYRLPTFLQMKSVWEMLKFQRYIEVAFEGDVLGLPEKQRPISTILEEHPELCYKNFEVEVQNVTRDSIAAQVALKDTWNWEGEKANFERLQLQFPYLATYAPTSIAERLDILETLTTRQRWDVDQYARKALVEINPQWIDESLSAAPKEKKTLRVRLKGGDSPLSGEHFLALLEIESSDLNHYTQNDEEYYAIRVLEKGQGWNLLPYQEVANDGTLDELLDSLLELAHKEMKWKKSYEECKEDVAKEVYADLFRSIGKTESSEELAMHRFDKYLSGLRDLASQNKEEFERLQSLSYWPLDVREEEAHSLSNELTVGEFSPVADGAFFRLLENKEIVVDEKEVAAVKNVLAADAMQQQMKAILKRL